MRKLLLVLVLAGSTVLVGLTPANADAAPWWRRGRMYLDYYAPGYYYSSGYYSPGYSYYYSPSYYTPGYTSSYYYTPGYTSSYYGPGYTTYYYPGYRSYYYAPRYWVWP